MKIALTALTLLASLPAAAGAQPLHCTQTTVTRPQYTRAVSGTVDGTDTLLTATVTRVRTGATDLSSTNPQLDNGFLGGYYLSHHNWNTWSLGTVQVGSEAESYYLMLPDTALPSGKAVDGLLFLNFNGGNDGNNQFGMRCTAG